MELYLYDRLRTEATQVLIATGLVPQGMVTLSQPKGGNIASDLAFPVFPVANALKAGNPAEYAKKVADAVRLPEAGLFARVEAAGGFVNFSVSPAVFAAHAIQEVRERGATFGSDPSVGKGEKTIVEFSSPNIAKRMHVGHLRTTVIGNSIRKIFVALGYDVIADNHLGDWGTQFGYVLASLNSDGFPDDLQTNAIEALERIYSDYSKRAKEDPALQENARFWFRQLEAGDTWALDTWKMVIDVSMREFERTYAQLGITFDTAFGESYYRPMLQDIVEEAVAKGVAVVEPEGAVSVNFGEGGPPSCLLRKTDGGTLYQTRDLATLIYRQDQYHPARNIYVVGSEQKLHFLQVFEIARRMGYQEIADRSIHISFGMITRRVEEDEEEEAQELEEGEQKRKKLVKFSTKLGNNVYMEDVLAEAISRARVKIGEQVQDGKSEMIDPAEIDATAEAVGIGAVIYSDLFQGPDRNIQFDWDKMLSAEGNTAPYIQYTHARCRSILRKAGEGNAKTEADAGLLVAPAEQATLKQLSRLPHAVREAGDKYLPATVADWTYNLAKAFNDFYHQHKVLTAETPELRQARLLLVEAVAIGLRNGLALLGITAPERM